jgi:hypothetical protein
MPAPKTIEEHREYLYEIVKLKLFFLLNWLQEHPDETLSDVLRNRIDIYRKTAVNSGLLNPTELRFEAPEWLAMEHQLTDVYKQFKNDPEEFEKKSFEIFKDSIDARLEADFQDDSALKNYQCGSLRYNEYEDGEVQETIGFHIANALQPHSIFEDPEYLPRCFVDLMDQTAKKYGSTRLSTRTWLNSLPRWLELFPAEWQENLQPPVEDVQWHYGFWGQFITARGTFNYKYGKILRETGKLPFYPKYSECSFSAMRKHLKEKYGV